MLIWGGSDGVSTLGDGGIYDPATNTWSSISMTSAPAVRTGHAAVWTGSQMIVWGGSNLNTGGIYNPASDSWIMPTTVTGAPAARSSHTAIWTGSQMIVWGGSNFNTGGVYK
jgi:hypothetical protein